MRVLIQTGRSLGELTETDLVEFATAVGHRETVHGRSFRHYRIAFANPAPCSTTWVHR